MPAGTKLRLLTAIKTSEWYRYDGGEPGYIVAGTHGTPDAIDLRAEILWDAPAYAVSPIEYRHVGAEEWLPTGYAGRFRYDVDRSVGEDPDGFRFHPYKVTDLTTITR